MGRNRIKGDGEDEGHARERFVERAHEVALPEQVQVESIRKA